MNNSFQQSPHAQLTEQQADILREVGNIGAGHAATALSTLLQDEVHMSVTSAKMCSFDEITETVGGQEAVVAGVFLRMTGDIQGNMMFLLPVNSAKQLIAKLLPFDCEEDDFTDLEISALSEVGNILGGSYLNAVSTLTSFTLNQTVPAVAIDMAGAILDIGILMAGEVADSAILIETLITQGNSAIDGHFFLLPDPSSTTPLLRELGCYDE